MNKESSKPTPYRVECSTCGTVYMTPAFYNQQVAQSEDGWTCPRCDQPTECVFDYEALLGDVAEEKECKNCRGTGVDKGQKCCCQD